ncbi:hypothetical protein [Nocardioides bruguierae]|uniref:Uncharacterized protein n=1 Tax=Nocardioides bruguierae TaxID=2945102 RepID=A0A9X2IG98_9ACTN|nr:hypothetical protein [Nocardioides bruguierae]MCM0621803.1 hypothetical protein [Nocardioides bruguierae]
MSDAPPPPTTTTSPDVPADVPADLLTELGAAREQVAEGVRQEERRRRAVRQLDAALRRTEETTAVLAAETADVAVLEGLSAGRLWSQLRGTRDDDLRRERAEQQRAEVAAARALADQRAVEAELEAVRTRLDRLRGGPARLERARVAVEQWLVERGDETGRALATLAEEVGTLQDRQRELAEAAEAAGHAAGALAHAHDRLDSAHGWSSYDTFFGGGMIGDAMKYNRLDDAQRAIVEADAALAHLARELADVDRVGVGHIGVSPGQQVFDVFFDNIISDWNVRRRIQDSLERVRRGRHQVDEVRRDLDAARREADAELLGLAQRRDTLLGRAGA